MKEKILVTGATGLVGSHFVETYSSQYELACPDYPQFNLLDQESIESQFSQFNPDWIIHLAAFTDVNASENQNGDLSAPAWQVNVVGTQNLLDIFPDKSRFIFISTDMVFSGNKDNPGPYTEDQPTESDSSKLSWYGWTKNQAEQLVKDLNGIVIRINYPIRLVNKSKLDYLHAPLKRYRDDNLYPLFSDQNIGITYIDNLSLVLDRIIQNNLTGIFHVSSPDITTPYDFISYAIDKLGLDPKKISKGSIIDYLQQQKNQYRYPVWGGLNCSETEEKLAIEFLSTEEIIDELVKNGLSLENL